MLVKNKKQFDNAIENFLANQPQVTPRCKHFGVCGGCRYQNFSYENQILAKLSALKALFSNEIEGLDYSITPSPQEYGYRVKMEYVLDADKFGLRKWGHFSEVVNLTECHLINLQTFKRVKALYDYAIGLGLDTFNLSKRQGFLKYLVIKEYNDQLMLNLITTIEDHLEQLNKLASYALEIGFSSINWIATGYESDLTYGSVIRSWGEQFLTIQILNKKYMIGANTFSQNNIGSFEEIIKFIIPEVASAQNVLDLYCGVGTIALQIAEQVKKVVGIEEVDESIHLAKQNAVLNNSNNVEFYTNGVQKFLYDENFIELDYWKKSDLTTQFRTENTHFDTIIVDPPRAGLGGKVARRLTKYFDPETLIYISCNPITQKEDLRILLDNFYIKKIRAFDLFPQTNHVENVIILTRRR